jgi:hypothetical protein
MTTAYEKPGPVQTSPTLVYLDLNKWIELAQAEAGHVDGKKYEPALRAAEKLASTGEAIFPLSDAHFMEAAKISDDGRRRRLAKLMVKLSGGWFLASASYLLMPELRRAVALQFQKHLTDEATAPISRSLKVALKDPDKLTVADLNEITSSVMLEELLATARVNRDFLSKWGRFAAEHEAGRELRWGVSREIRKRAYCAMVIIGILDRLEAVIREAGLDMNDLYALPSQRLVGLLERVPFFDVEINLHVERNEHRDRRIAPNDEIDLGFLSRAVPYCQVVVTEKFWTALVHRTKLDVKYGTRVGCDLNAALMSI